MVAATARKRRVILLSCIDLKYTLRRVLSISQYVSWTPVSPFFTQTVRYEAWLHATCPFAAAPQV